MSTTRPDHYATLGLDRRCTGTQIRDAYRLLAKQYHPDLNHGSAKAIAQTQQINAAYETLSDPRRRRAHDLELDSRSTRSTPAARARANITQDVHLRLEEFFRGATLEVRVNDPASDGTPEVYSLAIPPDTAPGIRFRVPRSAGNGVVMVRVKARPDYRFKVRGSDLRCDLRLRPERAEQGGTEWVKGPMGNSFRVTIPARVARGEIVRLSGQGLPKPRGGRGDLLLRILHTPRIQIRRAARR